MKISDGFSLLQTLAEKFEKVFNCYSKVFINFDIGSLKEENNDSPMLWLNYHATWGELLEPCRKGSASGDNINTIIIAWHMAEKTQGMIEGECAWINSCMLYVCTCNAQCTILVQSHKYPPSEVNVSFN